MIKTFFVKNVKIMTGERLFLVKIFEMKTRPGRGFVAHLLAVSGQSRESILSLLHDEVKQLLKYVKSSNYKAQDCVDPVLSESKCSPGLNVL